MADVQEDVVSVLAPTTITELGETDFEPPHRIIVPYDHTEKV